MLIPIGTDASIYHWPFATGALIVVNIVVFVLQGLVGEDYQWSSSQQHPIAAGTVQDLPIQNLDDERRNGDDREGRRNEWDFDFDEIERDPDKFKDLADEFARQDFLDGRRRGWLTFALWIGDGLHPLQWLTCCFLHLNILHLIGNMIFLGLFGLIIEGRLGSWQFAVYYLTIGVVSSFVTQLLSLGVVDSGVALGASGAIYGVMATAMLWTPRVNVICLFWVWFYIFFPRIPIMIFGIGYVLLDVTSLVFGDSLISTGFLHVIGAAVGLAAATVVLKKRLVDTEYDDFFSIVSEMMGKDPRKKRRKLSPAELAEQEENRRQQEASKRFRIDQIWRSIDAHLAADNLEAAIMMERQARQLDSKSSWDEPRLLKLIGKLQAQKEWDKVIHYSELYLKQFQSRAVTIQMNLAKILLLQKHSPRKALKTVQPLEAMDLAPDQLDTFKQIVLKAKQMIDAGTLELGE